MISGCSFAGSGSSTFAGAGPESGPGTYVFTCERDFRFSARVRPDGTALLRYGVEEVSVRQAAATSGLRYQGEGVTFTVSGPDGMLEVGNRVYRDCMGRLASDPWMESGMLGYDFRAVGQEPGWSVDVDNDGGIVVSIGFGGTRFEVNTPDRVIESSEAVSYTVSGGSRPVRILIESVLCRDTMSGESFPSRVTLTLNGDEYRGCGQPVDGRPYSALASVDWVLIDVEGLPGVETGSGREAVVRFVPEEFRALGFSGCNDFVAPFTLSGDRIQFRQVLAMTSLTCFEVERQEAALVAALRRATRFEIVEGELFLYEGNREVARFTARPRP